MSEQQSHATAGTTHEGASGLDQSELSRERQEKLRAVYEANVAAGKPPYEDARILTLAELQWVLRERWWSGEILTPAGRPRPDLRGADFRYTDLGGAQLYEVNLGGACLFQANLCGANLQHADLSGADLWGTDLSTADLSGANLSGANLQSADLTGAILSRANLIGADLSRADLSGADLVEARLGSTSRLAGFVLDTKTRLQDVSWQGVPLTRVENWPQLLGDEKPTKEGEPRHARIAAYRDAARAYRGLSIALRAQGLLIPASNYRLREQIMERKASFLSRNLLGWVFSWLLYLVAGYGERPVRSFFAYLLILFGFAATFFALGSRAHDEITSPLSALVFSVTSFHGRGFFPGGLALDDPITVLAALEAVIGLFIEITFIATFTQRFFGGR